MPIFQQYSLIYDINSTHPIHDIITNSTIHPLKHKAVAWITPAEIPNYAFCPADKDINERIAAVFAMNDQVASIILPSGSHSAAFPFSVMKNSEKIVKF